MKKNRKNVIVAGVLTAALIAGLGGCADTGTDGLTAEAAEASEDTAATTIADESDSEDAAATAIADESGSEDTTAEAISEESESEDAAAAVISEATEVSGTDESDASSAFIDGFESITVVDNDECSIVITGIDPDGRRGYTFDVELENKSEDTTYCFCTTYGYVNGFEVNPIFVAEVEPGKKAVDDVRFYTTTLEEYGVGDITNIELSFRVYDSDDRSSGNVAEETIHIYPYGEENASVFEYEPSGSDQILMDTDEMTLIVTGYEFDDIWGYLISVYMVNRTEINGYLRLEDFSVNDYMLDKQGYYYLASGKSSVALVDLDEDDLADIGVTDPMNDIEEIEFLFTLYDYDNYSSSNYYVRETFTLTP